MTDPNEWNRAIIAEFRANGGRVGGQFANVPLVLLTTTGARTGRQLTTPLVYQTDGERLIIFASKGGAPTHPAWYHNLVANPTVTIEVGDQTYQARAVVTEGADRNRLWQQQVAQGSQFVAYQEQTTRQIPIIALERLG